MSWFKTPSLMNARTMVSLLTGGGAVGAVSYRNRYVAAQFLDWKVMKLNNDQDSLRNADVAEVQRCLNNLDPARELFLVVLGPQGVGKSFVVQTALKNMSGVVHCNVTPGLSSQQICDLVFKQIWPYHDVGLFYTLADNAQNTIRAYTSRFRKRPCIVLNAQAKPHEDDIPAQVLVAAHSLALMGVKVVVDASQSSLGPSPAANRALPLYLGYMDWNLMRRIPEHTHFWKKMDELELTRKVQAIVGGCPRDIERLKEFSDDASTDQELVKLVNRLLEDRISDSMYFVSRLFAEYPLAKEAMKILDKKEMISAKAIGKMPENKVLRFANGVYVPRSPCMKVVLRSGLAEDTAHQILEHV